MFFFKQLCEDGGEDATAEAADSEDEATPVDGATQQDEQIPQETSRCKKKKKKKKKRKTEQKNESNQQNGTVRISTHV